MSQEKIIKKTIDQAYYFKSENTKKIINRLMQELGDFSIEKIKFFIDSLEKKKIGTINTTKSYLLSIANKIQDTLPLETYQFIQNYCQTKVKATRRVINLPSLEYCKDFYYWLYQKDRQTGLIFKTVLESGLRISEVKNINLAKSYKKGDFAYLHYLSPKAKKEDYIEVSLELLKELKQLGDYPFLDIDLTSFSNKLKRRIKAYNKVTYGSFPMISIHKIRHLHATLLLQGGVNLSLVSKRLGHSSPSVTSSFYDDTTITQEHLNLLKF